MWSAKLTTARSGACVARGGGLGAAARVCRVCTILGLATNGVYRGGSLLKRGIKGMCHLSLLRRRADDLSQLGLATDNVRVRTMLLKLSFEMTAEAVRLKVRAAAPGDEA